MISQLKRLQTLCCNIGKITGGLVQSYLRQYDIVIDHVAGDIVFSSICLSVSLFAFVEATLCTTLTVHRSTKPEPHKTFHAWYTYHHLVENRMFTASY